MKSRSVLTRLFTVIIGIAISACIGGARQAETSGPYKIVKTVKVGGVGGFDYIDADVAERRLYLARSGNVNPRILAFNLDTLEPVGEIPNTNAHGALVDPKSHHGFASSKPVLMFDSKTLAPLKMIEVPCNPDGMMFDPFNERLWVLSRMLPYVTVLNTVDGSVIGTVELRGPAEQAVSDGNHVYVDVDITGNDEVAVIDAKTLAVKAHYGLDGKGGLLTGLALDRKNHILFSTGRTPPTMVILNADNGKIITTLAIGPNNDGAVFDPATQEAFSSQGNQTTGTLTVVKENSPTDFVIEQTVQTITNGKTLTLDTKTNRVLIMGAEYGQPAPPTPDGRGGRGQMLPDSFSIIAVGK